MNVLLTGATGFIGSHILKSLIEEGHSVIVLKRSYSNCYRIQEMVGSVTMIDLDKVNLGAIFKGTQIDAVINVAGIYGREEESSDEMLRSNVLFPLTLLELAIANNVKLFINTDSFYNNNEMKPKAMYPYILTKKQLREWLTYLSNEIYIVNLKLHHVYGPNDNDLKFMSWLVRQHKDNVSRILLTGGEQERDFIYIDDVVSGYMTVLNHAKTSTKVGFDEFEIGTGIVVSLEEFIRLFHDVYCQQYPLCTSLLQFGALPYKDGELMKVVSDNQKIQSLGWKTEFPINKGVDSLISALKRDS